MSGQQSFTSGPASSAHTQRYTTSEHPAGQVNGQSSIVEPMHQNSGYQPTSQEIEAWMKQEANASSNQQTWMDQMQYSSYVHSSRALPQHGAVYQPSQQVSGSNVPGQHQTPSDLGTRGQQAASTGPILHNANQTIGSLQGFVQSASQQSASNGQLGYPTNDYQTAQIVPQSLLTAESFSNLSAADMDALNGFVFNMDPAWVATMAAPQMATSHQVSDTVDASRSQEYPLWNNGHAGGNNMPTSEAVMMANAYLAATRNAELGAQQQLWQLTDPQADTMQNGHLTLPSHTQNTPSGRRQCELEINGNGNTANNSTGNALQVNTGATSQHFGNDVSQSQYWNNDLFQTNGISQLNPPQGTTLPHDQSSSRGTHQQQPNVTLAPQNAILTSITEPNHNAALNTGWQPQEKVSQHYQMTQPAPQTLNDQQQGLPNTTAYNHSLQQSQYPNQPMHKNMNAAPNADPQFMAYAMSVHGETANMVGHSAIPTSAGYLKHSAITNHFEDLSLGGGEAASPQTIT